MADQVGVEHEHIVQDACSDDGTQDWLPGDKRVKAYIEKDAGMYDAINRGIRRSTGDLVAYLNCDEQYLPGTLKAVHDYFESHPDTDIVAAHFIVVDGSFKYICHRFAMAPTYPEAWHRFSVSTCAIFCRRRVYEEKGLWYDIRWRAVADAFWLLGTLRSSCRWSVFPKFTSVFADHGDNLILAPNSVREMNEYFGARPRWIRWLAPAFVTRYRLRMLASGAFRQKPFDYSVFTPSETTRRRSYRVEQPTTIWKGRA